MTRFAQAAAEMHTTAAATNPESMRQVVRDLEAIGPALGQVADALKAFTVKAMEEWPAHPGVSGTVGEVHVIVRRAAEAAAGIRAAIRAAHEHDLARFEQPRVNESMWDIGRL